MNRSKFNDFIKRYQSGKLSVKLRLLMDKWFDSLATKDNTTWSSSELNKLKSKIVAQINEEAVVPRRLSRMSIRIAAAAVILITLSLGLYFYADFSGKPLSHYTLSENDVAPGGNKATLTLANGRQIPLRSDKNGIIITANSLIYDDGAMLARMGNEVPDANKSATNKQSYSVLSTPKGGQYQITLSDGSRVWLNADSKLTYPDQFDKGKRMVVLEGEAYFEIEKVVMESMQNGKEKKVPFLVQMEGQQIEVLGTKFNSKGYIEEDNITTTLVEGKVKVSIPKGIAEQKKSSLILSPGEQSIVKKNQMDVQSVNVNDAIAWKNGGFMFNDEGIESVMRKLARWYDVEIVYQTPMNDVKIWGSVSRFKNISEVLNVIELTELVKFKVRGRRVYVMKT